MNTGKFFDIWIKLFIIFSLVLAFVDKNILFAGYAILYSWIYLQEKIIDMYEDKYYEFLFKSIQKDIEITELKTKLEK